MFEKIVEFIFKKFAPIVALSTLFVTLLLTVLEVKFFMVTNSEEIVLYFFFTLVIVTFVALLIAKIIELSRENPLEGEKNE